MHSLTEEGGGGEGRGRKGKVSREGCKLVSAHRRAREDKRGTKTGEQHLRQGNWNGNDELLFSLEGCTKNVRCKMMAPNGKGGVKEGAEEEEEEEATIP